MIVKYILSILTAFLLFTNCEAPNRTGYKTFTWQEGLGHCTFEYPAKYDQTLDRLSSTFSLTLYYPLRDKNDVSLIMSVLIPDDKDPNAAAFLDRGISMSPGDPEIDNCYDIVIDGIKAHGCTYHYMHFLLKVPRTCEQITFDYNGLIWDFYRCSDPTFEDIAQADFDHILQTFKILN